MTSSTVKEVQPDTNSHQWRYHITPDLRMLPSKLSFMFFYGSHACYIMYFNIFFTSVGLTASQAGQISGIHALSSLLGAPLWGLLADYTGKRKVLMLVSSIIKLCLIFPLPWIAEYVNYIDMRQHEKFRHDKELQHVKYCTTLCGDDTMFHVMMSMLIASGPLILAITSFLDSFVMNLVKSSTKETDFGRQRLFGSIGFGSASLIAGYAVDNYTNKYLSVYTAAFYVFLPLWLLFIPLAFYVAMVSELETAVKPQYLHAFPERKNEQRSLTMSVLKTCGTLPNMIFLFTVFLTGICNGLMIGFFYLYMKRELSSSNTVMGVSIAFGNLGELFMFPVSYKLIKMVGTIPCLISGIFAYFLRYIFLSIITDPWLSLPIQLLNAFCFALFIAAAIEHVVKISPKEICTTMVSIVNALKFGFGILVANMAGGATYDSYGGRMLFKGMAFICLAWTCFMIIYYYGDKLFRTLCVSVNDDKKDTKSSLNHRD
ncbi:uncharacterized transporter YwbF-like [Clytia hemisphaerica]|uniref:Major facilitator superfamily associated domain-containing protein n=1 Tax=Clytia hemisphaerica TaxID=252671 RepID=A0A7M5UVG9_9CNID